MQNNFYIPRKTTKKFIRYIPNIFTFSRLFLLPGIIFFIIYSSWKLAFVLFFAASLTDWLDGYLARRFDVESRFGKFLDPIVDKLLINSCIVVLFMKDFLPSWFFAIVVGSNFIVVLSAILQNIFEFEPKWHGKLNTFLLDVIILLVLLSNFPEVFLVSNSLLLVSSVLMILSCIMYIKEFSLASSCRST